MIQDVKKPASTPPEPEFEDRPAPPVEPDSPKPLPGEEDEDGSS